MKYYKDRDFPEVKTRDEEGFPKTLAVIENLRELLDIIKELNTLQAENVVMEEALQRIASKDKKRHVEESYWIGIDHASCARVLAKDTELAREALDEVKGLRKNALNTNNKEEG